jgi:hypothetical protein
MSKSSGQIALALLLVLCSLVVVGCKGSQTTPTVAVQNTTALRTPKPTFTPLPTDSPVAEQPSATVASASATPLVDEIATPTEQPSATALAEELPPTATLEPPTATPEPTAAATPRLSKGTRMDSPEYGMQAFLWWRPEVASRDLQKVREAGFTWVKVNFGWRDIEGAGKGQFDWSRTDTIVDMAGAEGLDLLVRIDHQPAWATGGSDTNGPPNNLQDLADFMAAIVGRYRGRVRAWEVWNEPNLAREWGGKVPDPGAYVKMLKVGYNAIKAADPNAIVISAGLSPTGTWSDEARPDDWYLESMYVAMGGSSAGYFDLLGAHAPGYKSPPEKDPAEVASDPNYGGQRAFCFRRVEDLRAIMVKYGDSNKQMALLEFGWTSDARPDSSYYWHAVSEETKADYLVRAYQYAKQNWSPWIGLMSLIYMSDPDWTEAHEQYWWSINWPSYPEFKPRPAYDALKAMPK